MHTQAQSLCGVPQLEDTNAHVYKAQLETLEVSAGSRVQNEELQDSCLTTRQLVAGSLLVSQPGL